MHATMRYQTPVHPETRMINDCATATMLVGGEPCERLQLGRIADGLVHGEAVDSDDEERESNKLLVQPDQDTPQQNKGTSKMSSDEWAPPPMSPKTKASCEKFRQYLNEMRTLKEKLLLMQPLLSSCSNNNNNDARKNHDGGTKRKAEELLQVVTATPQTAEIIRWDAAADDESPKVASFADHPTLSSYRRTSCHDVTTKDTEYNYYDEETIVIIEEEIIIEEEEDDEILDETDWTGLESIGLNSCEHYETTILLDFNFDELDYRHVDGYSIAAETISCNSSITLLDDDEEYDEEGSYFCEEVIVHQ